MKRYGLWLAIFLIFSSCSLKYDQGHNVESTVPEFSFSDVVFSRYEDKKIAMKMEAGQLEQYKDGASTFGKDVSFAVYEDGEIVTEGVCSYLGMDTKKEVYELFENIRIHNKKQNLEVTGKKFRWNGKNEQLTSGRNDMVKIEKDGMTIHGSGFSASGVSSSFSFNSIVTGTIETKDE